MFSSSTPILRRSIPEGRGLRRIGRGLNDGRVSACRDENLKCPVNRCTVCLLIIQCSSEAWDEELGLIYYNWRYYQAFLGKWTTRDPFHEMYDINLYSFIRNNINNIDSLGTKTVKGTLPLWRGSGTVAFSFDVSFRRNCVEVTLVLDLAGRDSSIENKFEREILSKWSNTHGITCGNSEVVYPITFKIKWMRWWRFFYNR